MRLFIFLLLIAPAFLAKFPDTFKFGVASSAYQVEGAWNADGKGESLWDRFTHNYPQLFNGTNGDVSCDSYNKLDEDIAMLKELKVDHYRFSISWTRLMPKGLTNTVNQAGVDYYNRLIDQLVANNIEPLVTIYHWDLPQSLDDIGGLYNPRNIEHFVDYADFLFATYGDRVKNWMTFNEPKSFCQEFVDGLGEDYFTTYPLGLMEYYCSNTVLKAHSQIYHLYQTKYKSSQRGKISIVLNLEWDEPASNKTEDIEAAERRRLFDIGLYLHPLVHGNYPKVVRDQVEKYSKEQGFERSRLTPLSIMERLSIIGTYDYLCLNQYSAWMIENGDGVINITNPSFQNDYNAVMYKDPSWASSPAVDWLKVAPQMLRKTLKWLKDTYNNPEIVVSENGYADLGGLNDTARIEYIKEYLQALSESINEDGVRVTRYTYWSLMDSFEWTNSYRAKFGLYHVDFDSANRTRTAKQSAEYYRTIIDTHEL